MKDPKTYVIMTGEFFLADAGAAKVTRYYLDAQKFQTFHLALKAFHSVKGFKCRIVQSYGTADETTVWKG